MLSVSEAQTIVLADVVLGSVESVSLDRCLGKTLRQVIRSPSEIPRFNKSLMDGFAICAEDLSSKISEFRVLEMITAGVPSDCVVNSGECAQIMTGAPLPSGTDAVIPVEQSELSSDGRSVRLRSDAIPSGTNVMLRGTLMSEGETLLDSGCEIRPQEIALLAESGYAEVRVATAPSVAILATGDELVAAGEQPGPGQIVNSNAPMLAAQVERSGGVPHLLGIALDRHDHLTELVQAGLAHDFLILSGGVSAGERDLVPAVLAECGVTQKFHKINLKPGKPIWHGVRTNHSGNNTYVFGTPGNPVSGMVCFELFIRPALRKFLGLKPDRIPTISVPLSQPHVARRGRPTYHPARLHWKETGASVEPVPWKGSSDLRATTSANCLICFPGEDRSFEAGEVVEVLPWNGTCFETA
ncbi:MAG TPA: gephyrin-like molybdotransferase Glp [Planctomycetaceae bacterium]|nr:gephyrin-like molybdotransferase Glp [Planctomycetaceae bacterium]